MKISLIWLFAVVAVHCAAQDWTSQKIVSEHREIAAHFGLKIALDDSTMLVSSPDETTDINGENSLAGAGAAYIYYQNENGSWDFSRR